VHHFVLAAPSSTITAAFCLALCVGFVGWGVVLHIFLMESVGFIVGDPKLANVDCAKQKPDASWELGEGSKISIMKTLDQDIVPCLN